MNVKTKFETLNEGYNNREDAKREIMDEIFNRQGNDYRSEADSSSE